MSLVLVIDLCYNKDSEKGAFFQTHPKTTKRGEFMPIIYDKLLKLMESNGITSYTLKKDNIIGQATFKKIKEGGDIDTRTIAKLCKLLNCQPGDIMEYVEDTAE